MSHRSTYICVLIRPHSKGRALAMLVALAAATPSPTLWPTATTTKQPPLLSEHAKTQDLGQPPLAGEQAGNGELVTMVITYTYDALYRLTAANYSDGRYRPARS